MTDYRIDFLNLMRQEAVRQGKPEWLPKLDRIEKITTPLTQSPDED
jgi:hypothetical protein